MQIVIDLSPEECQEIVSGLIAVKKECGKRFDEGYAWIDEVIDKVIEKIGDGRLISKVSE